jgi:cytochrome c556
MLDHAGTCRAALCGALLALAASVAAGAPGTDQDAIFARKTLKDTVCDKLAEIERMIARGDIDRAGVHRQADAIAVLLLAFPHLFPPGSNQWKPNADAPPETVTLASPEVWMSFADFYRQADAAAKSADALAHATTADDVKLHARELRIACDTCHAFYLEDQ